MEKFIQVIGSFIPFIIMFLFFSKMKKSFGKNSKGTGVMNSIMKEISKTIEEAKHQQQQSRKPAETTKEDLVPTSTKELASVQEDMGEVTGIKGDFRVPFLILVAILVVVYLVLKYL